jgi:hypothetical protein
MRKLTQSVRRVPGRPETAGNIGGLPGGMEGVGIADIEVAAARRDLGVVFRGKAQMQLDLAPAHKAIFRVCFARRAVGLHLETELPVMGKRRRYVPYRQDTLLTAWRKKSR